MNPDRKTPPAVSAITSITLPKVEEKVLDNGTRLITLHDPSLQINYFTAITNGGSAEAQKLAIANLAALLRVEGTESRSGKEITQLLDLYGSRLSFTVYSHYSIAKCYTLPAYTSATLELMADMLYHPSFPVKELEVAARKMASEVGLKEANVGYQAMRLNARRVFGSGHPLSVAPTIADIESTTRSQILDFSATYTRTDTTTLFFAGNMTPQVEKAIMDNFGSVKVSATPTPSMNIIAMSPTYGPEETITMPDASQSAVIVAVPAIDRKHPDYLKLRLTMMALGGYFGSRLSSNIREKLGLTYGISGALYGYDEGGVVQITTECSNASVGRVITEVGAELQRLVTDPPQGDELRRIILAETAALLSTVETPFSAIDFYQTIHEFGLTTEYFSNRLNEALSLTPETIAEIARKYLAPDKMIVSIAGNP